MEKVSFVLGALLKHENEQKKKISHACKEKDLSLSKHSCKKNYKKRYFWCVQWNGGSNHHGFQGCVHQKDPLTIDFTATWKLEEEVVKIM